MAEGIRRVPVRHAILAVFLSTGIVAGLHGGEVIPRKAVTIEVGGRIDLTLASWNDEMFEPLLGARTHDGTNTQVAELLQWPLGQRLGDTSVGSGGDVVFDPRVTLDIEVSLTDQVSGLVELKTPFYVFGDEGGTSKLLHQNASGGLTRVRRYLDVSQLYAQLNDVGLDNLMFRAGVQNYERDLRGDGNPFFISTNYAESAFDSLTGAPMAPGGNNVESQEAAGILGRYEWEGVLGADVFYFTMDETYEHNADDTAFGAAFDIYFDPERRWGKVTPSLIVLQNDAASYLYTLGSGVQFYGLDRHLELYGEFYGQWGMFDRNFHVNSALLPYTDRSANIPADATLYNRLLGRKIKQAAWAGYAGFRYTFDLPGMEDVKPYVDGSYWELSGDDDATDSYNKNFVSLENNNQSLIVENAYFGLDIDTNYRAARAIVGFWPYKTVRLEGMYAYFELQRNNGLVDVSSRRHNKIGDEVDVRLIWTYTDYLRVMVGTGWLWDAKAMGTLHPINLTMFKVQLDF
ncbi:MAG: hypothetical protein JXP34_00185 [Planctomycetes bacterium]|nr:hypothetical protein [Planctomycetota bacterium]